MHAHVQKDDERGEIGRLREEVASLLEQVESASARLDEVEQSES
jgi:hypothetical protein